MPERYTAFLSYAHRYQAWVEVLHRGLEAGLAAANRPGKVFLDEADLASGRSWVGQLQAGLDRAGQLILVITPEALASPRVADEWQSFLATRQDWHEGKLHLVHLVETPLPPFFDQIQFVDFREADEEKYRRGLQELLAGILGASDRRNLPALPAGLEIPAPPDSGLPAALRNRLVGWLTPLLGSKVLRRAIASCLGLAPEKLEGQPSWACAASAALVWATAAEDPVAAALRIVEVLEENLGEDEPDRVAALGPLREELRALRQQGPGRGLLGVWLRQVAADHERLAPYFQRQVKGELLDRVYVQLELQPGTLQAVAPHTKAERLERPLGLREVLGLDRAGYPWVTGRWVVLGDPGAGKTLLLRQLSASLARQENRPWVPLYESLPRLLHEGRPLLDRVVRRLELAGHPAPGLKAVLDREGQQGRLLVLLDGLDEVPRDEHQEAEELLRDLAATWPASPLVVASRPIGYRRPGSAFRELVLLPLSGERRREFLARWFGRATGRPDEARAAEALASLEGPGLSELAGNPLYLTLMALLFERGTAPDRNRTRLYDQVFELLLEGKHRFHEGLPIERPAAVRQALRHLAFSMTVDNRDAEPRSRLEERLYQPEAEEVCRALERVPRWRQGLRSFFDELAERTGILGPHDGPDADWRFWHRTFREALAAERMAEEYRGDKGRAAVLARARTITAEQDQSRWAEPFSLLVGQVEAPDELVRALVQENRPLGLRALATAQTLADDTVREILALSEEWEERREVYGRLPELVGEPRRVLALLDQLRRRTRNGNDLFFLDLAVREVARQFSEHAREGDRLRARLYDHIRPPAAAEELFTGIETPADGRVSLWREIPAGWFWMGSLESDGSQDEHPRHQVTIARPFCCGAVPVTRAQYAAFDPERRFADWEEVAREELPHHPAAGVTWYEAVSFCRWLASVFAWARGVRLPAEEEWEYVCRAGTKSLYWSGDREGALARAGWYEANSDRRTHRVGEKPANPWGLYDVHGNVWEWTLSSSTSTYEGRERGAIFDPSAVDVDAAAAAATGGGVYVLRGGGYWNDADAARAAYRYSRPPSFELGGPGFRIVLPPMPPMPGAR
jgi:formylglycine-generating enzyme required for sulfatase activity